VANPLRSKEEPYGQESQENRESEEETLKTTSFISTKPEPIAQAFFISRQLPHHQGAGYPAALFLLPLE
jgi:hypothetical protein